MKEVFCDGKSIKLYNIRGRFIRDVPISQAIPMLTKGRHTLKYDCTFPAEGDSPSNRIVIKAIGEAEVIRK